MIKEIFPPKTGMREKQLLQDPGSKGSKVHAACCMVHCTLQGCMKYPYVKRVRIQSKNSHKYSLISLMSNESKVHSIYNVDSNSKYLN